MFGAGRERQGLTVSASVTWRVIVDGGQESDVIGGIQQNLGDIGRVIESEIFDIEGKSLKITGDLGQIGICRWHRGDLKIVYVNVLTVSTCSSGEYQAAGGWRPGRQIRADNSAALPDYSQPVGSIQFNDQMLPAKVGVSAAVGG